MRVIFSGFDGVLHPQHAVHFEFGQWPARLFEWVDILEALLAPHEDVFVVAHSHWRQELTDGELAEALRPLKHRFLGSVPRGPRYPGIRAWLQRNPSVQAYRILDDQPHEFPSPPPAQLLVCHPETGVYDWRVRHELRCWLHDG